MSYREEIEMMLATTVKATCCREWEVAPFAPMGRCGYCGQVPQISYGKENPHGK